MNAEALFLPPEAFGASAPSSSGSMSETDPLNSITAVSSWDAAVRYHDFKKRVSDAQKLMAFRSLAADAILERARSVLGSVVRPTVPGEAPLDEVPLKALDAELDLESTFENSPEILAGGSVQASALWMSYKLHRSQGVVLAVDTSLSMTGEKLALTAVALAVVLLQFPEDPIGIVAFENEAQVLKKPDEMLSVRELVERFMDVPAQGYTHLEEGLRTALVLSRAIPKLIRSERVSTVLLTDGKYTAGRDPAYLASLFKHLVVMKMGRERSSKGLCEELAQKGSGMLREVPELEVLPQVMYGVVKDLLRARSRSS
jgi:hypothetical protein